ncbi:MAG TPA: Cu(I)-responsive transcriptional regulator [Steroidobacteraceae bacterium]|jgi:MerR family copper efflux transcriptional regulator|nr:Cu(I)-responsive transcriptional regulator [Steroidobacteraceae bacterium]
MKSNGMMTIGQASASSGVPPKTIRFYEDLGLIKPAERLANRYRAYDDNNVRILRFIRRARALGFSLREIEKLLSLYRNRRRASEDVKRLALSHVADLDCKIAELKRVRDTIAELARRCQGGERPQCPILDDLEASTH